MSLAGRPSQNGDKASTKVPPNIEWDPDNPPFVYPCSETTEHSPNCNGEDCEGRYWVESEVILSNLAKEFGRNNIPYEGVIEAYRGIRSLPGGFNVDPFYLLCWLEAMKKVLIDAGVTDQEVMDEAWRQEMISRMQPVVDEVIPQLKEQRTKAALGIVDKKVIGPGGHPIN